MSRIPTVVKRTLGALTVVAALAGPSLGTALTSGADAAVPVAARRAPGGPSHRPAMNGPAMNGPAMNGPAMNGPAMNGPALNGASFN